MQNTWIRKLSIVSLVLVILVLFVAWFPKTQSRIFLIGDSTMADKPLVDNPEHGWGQMLRCSLQKMYRSIIMP